MYEIREEHAQNLNLPPNTVVSNNDLFALVRGDMRLDQVSGNRRIRPEQLQSVLNDMRGVLGAGDHG
jgi:ribonuclease D